MKRTVVAALIVGSFALGASAANAAGQQSQNQKQTPQGWSYNLKNGQRVPKGDRQVNADGSWREEVKQGNCVTVKEKSASGEYKETRQCNPR